MSSRKTKVTVRKDNTKEILKNLEELKRYDVLVGVPQSEAERDDDSEITNAQLMFIHSEGSPVHNIPPRPVIDMTIKEEKENINKKMKKVIQSVLNGASPKAELEKLGIYVSNKVKAKFGSEDLAPLQPATIKAKGSDRPLIDTGQLRNSITYIVREK